MYTKKATLPEINAVAAAYVDETKIGAAWTASTANVAGLLDKIAKTFTLDGSFTDKLEFMDGEELPLGKTLEEYYQDLILAQSYEDGTSGTDYTKTLAPYDPTYRPASYSYTLGRKFLPITERYDNLERACNTQGEYSALVSMINKRLWDSFAMFKFSVKKEIIAKAIDKIATQNATTTTFTAGSTYAVGTILRNGSTTTRGVVVKAYANSAATWAAAVENGYIVEFTNYKQVAKPTDTASGEAFIKQVKNDIESLGFATEGNSFNGNTLGATEGVVLVIPKGITASLDVDTLAGAFHLEKLAMPCEIVVVDSLPTTNGYAVLMDKRAMRLNPTYRAVREQTNAKCDFITYFLHTENTAFISNNCAIIAYHE